jgi:Damage-control phosphatase ARMT1-like domain
MASPIRSNVPGSFPESVLQRRHPAIVDRVLAGHPYPPAIRQALVTLREEVTGGRIEPFEGWGHAGERWVDQPFLWAEALFYRKLLVAAGYFGPGPWLGIDPFGPQKAAELRSVPGADPGLDRAQLLHAALLGNRADLGFRLLTAGDDDVELLVDDSAEVWRHLDAGPPGTVCVLNDNAGTELLADLLLAAELLRSGLATGVELHLKPHPTFVSDATTADLVATVEHVRDPALWDALRDGRIEVVAHPFAVQPVPYRDMPADLTGRLAAASLTIAKGDLNYRRLVADCDWPPTDTFAARTAYFPSPVVALRTLKSDVIVGLDAATVERLDELDKSWRTRGKYAVVQFRR